MKALVYNGVQDLVIRETPPPEAGDDDVVVCVEACGICGSDMHAFFGHDPARHPGVILGHEVAGTIFGGPRDGERVVLNPLVSCGKCDYCARGRPFSCMKREIISKLPRQGGFADYVVIPSRNAYRIPDTLPFPQAALAEPIAVGFHAIEMARPMMFRRMEEARCCVIGGGPIGLGAALSLGLHAPRSIHLSERDPGRRAVVERQSEGRCVAFAPEEGGGPARGTIDLVLDCVGSPASRAAASEMAARGAVIVHVGILEGGLGLDTRLVTIEELIFMGSYCYAPEEFKAVVAAMAAGRLGKLDWFEARPLEDGLQAFRDIASGAARLPKLTLLPRALSHT